MSMVIIAPAKCYHGNMIIELTIAFSTVAQAQRAAGMTVASWVIYFKVNVDFIDYSHKYQCIIHES